MITDLDLIFPIHSVFRERFGATESSLTIWLTHGLVVSLRAAIKRSVISCWAAPACSGCGWASIQLPDRFADRWNLWVGIRIYPWISQYKWNGDLPSGNLTYYLLKIAIYSRFSHWKWWFSVVMFVDHKGGVRAFVHWNPIAIRIWFNILFHHSIFNTIGYRQYLIRFAEKHTLQWGDCMGMHMKMGDSTGIRWKRHTPIGLEIMPAHHPRSQPLFSAIQNATHSTHGVARQEESPAIQLLGYWVLMEKGTVRGFFRKNYPEPAAKKTGMSCWPAKVVISEQLHQNPWFKHPSIR